MTTADEALRRLADAASHASRASTTLTPDSDEFTNIMRTVADAYRQLAQHGREYKWGDVLASAAQVPLQVASNPADTSGHPDDLSVVGALLDLLGETFDIGCVSRVRLACPGSVARGHAVGLEGPHESSPSTGCPGAATPGRSEAGVGEATVERGGPSSPCCCCSCGAACSAGAGVTPAEQARRIIKHEADQAWCDAGPVPTQEESDRMGGYADGLYRALEVLCEEGVQ